MYTTGMLQLKIKPKATHTQSQYVILIVFPLQRCLKERASMLRRYVNCLYCKF